MACLGFLEVALTILSYCFAGVPQRRRREQGEVLRAGGREETRAGEVADAAPQHRRTGSQICLRKAAGCRSWEQV